MAALAAGGGLAAIRGLAGGGLGGGGGAGGAAALRQVPLLERELKTVRAAVGVEREEGYTPLGAVRGWM